MKKSVVIVAVIICCLLAFIVIKSQNSTPKYPVITGDAIAFTNVNVLPMTRDTVFKNQTVVIKDDRIFEIADSDKINLGKETVIINASGKYLMPGLGEMHGHVPPSNPPPNAPRYITEKYVKNTLFLYTASGVTTVRGMLGWPDQLTLKERVKSKELIGPNLYLAGPSFNGNSIHSTDEAVEKVIQQNQEGWDLLKIHPGLSLQEYDAIVEKAKELGINFGGHIPSDVGIVHAIESGQKSIDHMDGYVAYISNFPDSLKEQKIDEIISLTIENKTWIVPTLALWETIVGAADYDEMQQYDELMYIPDNLVSGYNSWAKRKLESPNTNIAEAKNHAQLRKDILYKMNVRGANILMGTDAPQLYSVPGFSIHREIKLMNEAGMSPFEILYSATNSVGKYFSYKDNFGTITKGARADLILLDGNPVSDLNNLKYISGVMVSGTWMSKYSIDERLKKIANFYAKEKKAN